MRRVSRTGASGKRSLWWFATGPLTDFRGAESLRGVCDYAVGQGEEGDGENNYRHVHAVVRFNKRVSFERAKEAFGPTFHVEAVKRRDKAIQYAQKEEGRLPGTAFEFGRRPLDRSSASDWGEVYRLASEGKMEEIPPDIRVRCAFQLDFIRRQHFAPRTMWHPRKTVWCFWGPTGTGKTRKALEILSCFEFYEKNSRTKWWDGYRGQPAVLIDEFNGSIHWDYIKMWTDKYVNRPIEMKGSVGYLTSLLIIITSQKSVDDWWPEIPECDLEAVKRRIIFRRFMIEQM